MAAKTDDLNNQSLDVYKTWKETLKIKTMLQQKK